MRRQLIEKVLINWKTSYKNLHLENAPFMEGFKKNTYLFRIWLLEVRDSPSGADYTSLGSRKNAHNMP